MRKWFILIFIILLVIVGYNYVYQDHRNIEKEVATVIISSTVISNEFSQNPSKAEKKYLNKTVEIFGLVTELNKKDLTLDYRVFCQFENEFDKSLIIDSKFKIKGRVIGYDDLLEEVKLDQCYIIN